jgi:hypothetical protein
VTTTWFILIGSEGNLFKPLDRAVRLGNFDLFEEGRTGAVLMASYQSVTMTCFILIGKRAIFFKPLHRAVRLGNFALFDRRKDGQS